MWLTSFMAKNIKEQVAATAGSVSGADSSTVQVEASQRHLNVPLIAPYGVVCVPPSGEQAVLVHTLSGDACVGVTSPACSELEPGEIMLRSAGGATLVLKNDGRVLVNGKELGGA